jgi:hypothetical protein
MLDFAAVKEKRIKFQTLVAPLTKGDLIDLTNEMIDKMLVQIQDCTDDDVVFVPEDPVANDTFAASSADTHLAWTLSHVIVHVTASSEESAALAAELARGVELHGRSRYEAPWETVTTIAQCRARLEESRRMRLASLAMWPEPPHLENTYIPWPAIGEIDARGRFVLGLRHDSDHLGQIDDIVQQAKAARAMPAAVA